MIDKEDEEFLAGLLQEFIDNSPIEMEELEEILLKYDKSEDQQLVRDFKRRLHSMKGSAQSINLFELATLLHNLETWVNSNLPTSTKQNFVSFCLSMIDGMREYFKALGVKSAQANTLLQGLSEKLKA